MMKAILTAILLFFLFDGIAQKKASPVNISPSLKLLIASGIKKDSIDVLVQILIGNSLRNVKTISKHQQSNTFIIRIQTDSLNSLLEQAGVLFADVYISPKEELTTGSLDLATNKINYSHERSPEIHGENFLASIKENRFDTTDIDVINRYINTGLASPAGTTHASIIATALAGAGNSSPYAKGVAYKSKLTSSNFANILPDPDSVFQKYNVSVQNHSYGTIIQNYYGIEAAAYDAHAKANPTIVHVFSSGNSGADTATSGKYAGLKISNHTGNFKWAKNVLTVGATDSFYNIATLSSKGPAYDGRVKPELVAFAESGSSGAAALVSGAAVLIQQAFLNKFQRLPSTELTKAILINSADDVGTKGIDFMSGYGSLNLYKSIKTVNEENIIENVLVQNQIKTYAISIPQNTAQIKITLAWTDVAAAPNAAKALINDLDVTLVNQLNGDIWHPWVLNSSAHIDSLMQVAKRSIDTLNNVELITVDNPTAGNYLIEVKGSKILNSQAFAIAYQIDSANHFEWTFPTKKDPIEIDKGNVIRWQTTVQASGSIEFSTNGQQWDVITSSVDLSTGYYKWNPPPSFTRGMLRMTIGNSLKVVSDTFVLSSPTALITALNCTDSFMFYWKKLPVNQYQLYKLEGAYLEPFYITSDTAARFSKSNHSSLYYAVAPIVDGKEGLRSHTINYTSHGVGCYFRSFYLQTRTETEAVLNASIGTVYNVQSIQFQKWQNNQFISKKDISFPLHTSFLFTDSALQPGINLYRIKIQLQDGREVYSNTVTVYHFDNSDLIVYPNPVQQYSQINMITRIAGRLSVDIYNESGILIKKLQLNNLLNQLPAFMLSKGIYFLRATTDEGKQITQKLVVQ